jgi:hypothetical protein
LSSSKSLLSIPADIEHFRQHEHIEAIEEARVREFQGLPAEGGDDSAAQVVLGGEGQPVESPVGSPRIISDEEKARGERMAYAIAQAKRFGHETNEANKRGDWGTEGVGFRRPRDNADRLRRGVPYKFKASKKLFGEFCESQRVHPRELILTFLVRCRKRLILLARL